MPSPAIDLFCRVIDNHGDLGVCWRLARLLAARGREVRLFVDDASALAWMAPPPWPAGIEVCAWAQADEALPRPLVIETFGCELPAAYQAKLPGVESLAWINLEYLSAEDYVERSHGLCSPVMSGPAKGLSKRFCYPGFTPRTGGLMKGFEAQPPAVPGARPQALLFCYEPQMLASWLAALAQAGHPCQLAVAPGRPAAAVRQGLARAVPEEGFGAQAERGPSWVSWLPHVSQTGFDQWLATSALNIVRGEDSFARAQWAGRPFVWHIYPQDDDVHLLKLDAFLDRFLALGTDPALAALIRDWHALLNGTLSPEAFAARQPQDWPWPRQEMLVRWTAHTQAWQLQLQAGHDLVDTLLAMASGG